MGLLDRFFGKLNPQRKERGQGDLHTLVNQLCEYAWGRGVLERQSYFDAFDRVVGMGQSAIPLLVANLGKGSLIAAALGKIGGHAAIDALAHELHASDWRRVEAAARGLGHSKDPAAKAHIESVRGSALDQSVAEVHYALNWALDELYKATRPRGGSSVDRENIWLQIQSLSAIVRTSPTDQAMKDEAIALWQAIVDELPDVNVKIPGYSYAPADAKARAWASLALEIYYLRHGDRMMSRPCPEAKRCLEEALKLKPEGKGWPEWLHGVSSVRGDSRHSSKTCAACHGTIPKDEDFCPRCTAGY